MTRPRPSLRRLALALVVLSATMAPAWAITRAVRDDGGPETAAPARSESAAPPLAEELAAQADRTSLPGGSKAGTGSDADEAGSLPLQASEITPGMPPPTRSMSPELAAVVRELPIAPVAELDDERAAPGREPSNPDTSSPAASSTTESGRGGGSDSGDGPSAGETDIAGRLAARFVDPCAARPSACADVLGRRAVGATIELTSDEPDPVRINGLTISSGTSEGCADAPVPPGRRAIGVLLNRPAALTVSWRRRGGAVGTVESFEPTDSDRERFDVRSRTWRTCLDVAFPTDGDQAAQATVIATADDGTTATDTVWAFDDDRRRLLIADIGLDDELVALTPRAGETTIGAAALRDDEDQVAGCRRVIERLLADRPRAEDGGTGTGTGDPFDLGAKGTPVPEDVLGELVAGDGEWRAVRFTGLRESQRYAICLYSIGSTRSTGAGARAGRQVEATDAVLVQPPDRERYQVRPLELLGPGSIDGDTLRVRIDNSDVRLGYGWSYVADTAESAEQPLPEGSWFTFGDVPAPEVMTATVDLNGRTSEALVPFPARCVAPTSCDPVGAARLVRLDIPGRDYTRRLCGTGEGACGDGLRRRSEVLGSVILLIERVESPIGSEGWTIGESRRFDAEIPEPYWVAVTTMPRPSIAPDGTVSVTITTDVASSMEITLWPCGLSTTSSTVTITTPAVRHDVVFPEPLGYGGCTSGQFVVSDPTGARIDETGALPLVYRPYIRADVAVQMTVLSWPDSTPEGYGGLLRFGANEPMPRPPFAFGSSGRFDCGAPGTTMPDAPSVREDRVIGELNRIVVRLDNQPPVGVKCGPGPTMRVVDAELDVPWTDLADGSATVEWERNDPRVLPDPAVGFRARFTITVTNVRIP